MGNLSHERSLTVFVLLSIHLITLRVLLHKLNGPFERAVEKESLASRRTTLIIAQHLYERTYDVKGISVHFTMYDIALINVFDYNNSVSKYVAGGTNETDHSIVKRNETAVRSHPRHSRRGASPPRTPQCTSSALSDRARETHRASPERAAWNPPSPGVRGSDHLFGPRRVSSGAAQRAAPVDRDRSQPLSS